MKNLQPHLTFLFAITSLALAAQLKYPATKTVSASDTYFGVTYQDPYRWLEDIKDTTVSNWFKNQADLSNEVMSKIAGRDELIAEWKKLDNLQAPRISGRQFASGRLFYRKTMPGENVGKLYYREGLDGKDQLLFDPSIYIKGKTLTIQNYLPSYDGKKIAITYSEAGAEISTIKILDVASKTILPETLYPTWNGAISWTFDNKSFTYQALTNGDSFSEDYQLNTKTKLHTIGDDVKKDKDFLSVATYPNLEIIPEELPLAGVNKDSKEYIFADLVIDRPEMRSYFASINQFNANKIDWKLLCKPEDKIVRARVIISNDIYAITSKAKNYQLIHTTLPNPDWINADVVAPEKQGHTLESFIHCKDYLLLTYSDGINNQVYKYHFKTKKITEIKLPFSGSVFAMCLDTKTNTCLLFLTSWNKPTAEFNLDVETNSITPSPFNKPLNYPSAYSDLIVEEVEVKGHDGEMIPLSIIYKKGLKRDGTNVALMDSYGAYGFSMSPYFDIMTNALAVKGVVLAYPHVRGGSEKGEAWYRAGLKTTKPNTWKDFNSCGEYLVAQGFTSKNKLAGMGTSAGGVLISRAITERPDLYAAAICNVGCANAMRMEVTPNGPTNIPEFGTVKDSVECKALYEMDGVAHVVKGTKYPAVMCVAGWNDPRVIAWEPGKFAAALQNASTSTKPVLMKVNYDNGHFTEDKSVTYANFADQYAFVLWQCGHPDFQMKK